MLLLETPRLLMRELHPADLPDLRRQLQDPQVMYAYEGPLSDREVDRWYERQCRRYRDDGFGLWALIEKGRELFIGQCGITLQPVGDRRLPEIGYLLCADHWHQGFATEAAIACLEWGFHVRHFPTLCSIIRDTNIASQRVALRLGMTRTGTIVKHYRGIDMPHYLFRIDRPEASSNQQASTQTRKVTQ